MYVRVHACMDRRACDGRVQGCNNSQLPGFRAHLEHERVTGKAEDRGGGGREGLVRERTATLLEGWLSVELTDENDMF